MKGKYKVGVHHNFKGGVLKASHGYIIVFVGKHHHLADCRGYAYQHRLVMEDKVGRAITKQEYVHHIDHDRANNNPNNLELYPSKAHHFVNHRLRDSGLKMPDESNDLIQCACGCGGIFYRFDKANRPRKYLQGHNGRKHGN